MEEAERLCDRVAIVDHGRLVALDTPEHLISGLGAESQVIFTVDGSPELEPLRVLPEVRHVQQVEDRVILSGSDTLLSSVVQALPTSGIRYRDIRTQRATLDDVFLQLTGRAIRD
jgi:ABC-2 type transport system ATP-binding protein